MMMTITMSPPTLAPIITATGEDVDFSTSLSNGGVGNVLLGIIVEVPLVALPGVDVVVGVEVRLHNSTDAIRGLHTNQGRNINIPHCFDCQTIANQAGTQICWHI
eukprot:TRINITY_DN11841_c0_g1_i2.p5 TRINITY_DN11841_c0_g1~~TRINITY_DN11841_c0_g1_i2.p5  ORF type:complete len:105 (-),score=6.75 TRINITY_DN11841_c0_g1_i2:3010-3324(-)